MSVKRVLVFPGQGQLIPATLLKELHKEYNIEPFFEGLDSQISPEFSRRLFESNPSFFQSTANNQPAVTSVSLLLLDTLKRHHGVDLARISNYTLGHSLGEFASLVINDVFNSNKSRILWLVQQRGQLMEEVVRNGTVAEKYRMFALIFPAENHDEVLEELKAETSNYKTVSISNINSPQQIVVSGEKSELEQFVRETRDHLKLGRRFKSVPLEVDVPFHNSLLETTKFKFKDLVSQHFDINEGKRLDIPIISNVDGQISLTHGEALAKFIEAFAKPVQFKASIERIMDEVKEDEELEFITLGPNSRINKALIEKIDSPQRIKKNSCIETVEDIKIFINDL